MNARFFRSLICTTALSVFAIAGVSATPVVAQDVAITSSSIANRITLAGAQRMLAERMAAQFCFARSQIATFESIDELSASLTAFKATHDGFKRGDAVLGLFPEEDKSLLKAWSQTHLLWVPLKGLYEQILEGDFVTEEDFELAMGLTVEVRTRKNDLVARLRSVYADRLTGDGFGDALLLDLYGRQRMLSQKLSKEVCLASAGYKLDETLPELQATLKLLERSLAAFIEGLPVAGVPKPPTQEIADQLSIVKDDWNKISYVPQTIVSGGSVGLNDMEVFRTGSNLFLLDMNKAVKMLKSLKTDGS